MVVPMRSEKGSRLNSQDDVGRLALIKRLVDSGDAISRVAKHATNVEVLCSYCPDSRVHILINNPVTEGIDEG